MSAPKNDPVKYDRVSHDRVILLDSYALLAYLAGEAGCQRVVEALTQAQRGRARVLLCAINFGEILYIVERRRGLAKAQQVQALIESLPVEIVDPSRELVLAAAHIKAQHPISYADAFAVALAAREKALILTGDPEFNSVTDLVSIEWLPGPASPEN